jgi:sterol desaturase/sphingolipid hydroxylase (fatty acid hydroxylase superfamily)
MSNQEEKLKIKHSGSKQVFNNPILEKLTRTHISVPITILMSFAAFLLYVAFIYTDYTQLSAGYVVALFFIGLLTFTLVEYLAHRYVFHMDTNTPLKKKIQYALHGIHHEYPKDKGRLAMPPIMSAILAATLFFTFRALMGTPVFGFLPGFITGYCAYLFVHYIVHAYQPPKNFFKHLWLNHAIHHYKGMDGVYGVSSPLWDYVFRTMTK